MNPVVMVWERNSTSYCAAPDEDGTVWSLDCGHCHKTPEEAIRCFRMIQRIWDVWGNVPREPMGNDVWCMTIPVGDPKLRLVRTMRMHPLDERMGYRRWEGAL